MPCRFKTLLALGIAACAFSGVAASAVQAAEFTASSYPASFTGTSALGNTTLVTEAGKTECQEHFQGSLSEGSESLTVDWTLEKCAWFGSPWKVNETGCDLRFRLTGGSGGSYTGVTDIVCPEGGSIDVEIFGCSFRYPPQTGLGTIEFTNLPGGNISMQAYVTGIKYVVVKDPFGCPMNGVGEKTGATYTHYNPIWLTSAQSLDIG